MKFYSSQIHLSVKSFFYLSGYRFIWSVFLCSFIFLLASCNSTKKSIYFRGLEDTVITTKIEAEPPVIKQNDLLSIKITSLNPHASEVFNSTQSLSMASNIAGASSQSFGYLVDQDGEIQFPILGILKAQGLTQKQLEDTIQSQLLSRKLLIDPIVTVRYLNFKISVLGEVDKPSVYNIPSEKVTLLEALSLAGDMTIYAKRNNVLLIREEDGQRKVVRLDLSSSEILYSPYYYLKSNDIIYVEPKRSKVATTHPIGPWVSAVFGTVSLIVVILTNVKL